jgi:hypothetical protein
MIVTIIAAVIVVAALLFFLVGNLRRPVPERHRDL